MVHLNFTDNRGALITLFERCHMLRRIKINITHGGIQPYTRPLGVHLDHILHFIVYAQEPILHEGDIFSNNWMLGHLNNLRLDNIPNTKDTRDFLLRHINKITTLELCVQYDDVQGILDEADNLVCFILHI